jgi:hypothetical protein
MLPDPFLINDITGLVTRLTRRVSLVEQELLTLSEHPSLTDYDYPSDIFKLFSWTHELYLVTNAPILPIHPWKASECDQA